MGETERLYSVEEVADHLNVSQDTIRAWIKKDVIPFYKVGRRYKFNMSEIDEWVKSGKSADADK